MAKTIAENVRRLREERGMSMAELARRVGVRLYAIQSIERGRTRKSKYLPDIARILGVPLSEIDPTQAEHLIRGAIAHEVLVHERDLPVYGMRLAGNGVSVMSDSPVDRVDRPTSLAHVRDAYGVIVRDGSMTPAVRAGDIVVVNPHLPPRIEDICIFRQVLDGEILSVVREYVSETTDGWRVRQYRPQEEYVLKQSDWPEGHVVVAVFRR